MDGRSAKVGRSGGDRCGAPRHPGIWVLGSMFRVEAAGEGGHVPSGATVGGEI